MLTLDKLNERETEIKGYLQHAQEQIKQTVTRAEQMKGALECIALLKKDYEAAEAGMTKCPHGVPDCHECVAEEQAWMKAAKEETAERLKAAE